MSDSPRPPFPDVLEDKQVEIHGWADVGAALDLLRADRERWLAEQQGAAAKGTDGP